METAATRPLPDTRGAGRQYWASGLAGKLALPKCQACGQTHWYPRLYCPHCGGDKLEWVACSGRGVIHTYTVVRHSAHPYFKTRVPYVLAMVALEEGPLIMSNVVDCAVDAIHIDARVTIVFETLGDGASVPLFRLAAAAK